MRYFLHLEFVKGRGAVEHVRGGARSADQDEQDRYKFAYNKFNLFGPSLSQLNRCKRPVSVASTAFDIGSGIDVETIELLAAQIHDDPDQFEPIVGIICDEVNVKKGGMFRNHQLIGALQGPVDMEEALNLTKDDMATNVVMWSVVTHDGKLQRPVAWWPTTVVSEAQLQNMFLGIKTHLDRLHLDVLFVSGDCLASNLSFLEWAVSEHNVAGLADYVHVFKLLAKKLRNQKELRIRDVDGVWHAISLEIIENAMAKGHFLHLSSFYHLYPKDMMKVGPLLDLVAERTTAELRQLATTENGAEQTAMLLLAEYLEQCRGYFAVFDVKRTHASQDNPKHLPVVSLAQRCDDIRSITEYFLNNVQGLTAPCRKALTINSNNFIEIIETVIPGLGGSRAKRALASAKPRSWGTDWQEWFFGVMRQKKATMSVLEVFEFMRMAPVVALWTQCSISQRGYALPRRTSGNKYRRYVSRTSFV